MPKDSISFPGECSFVAEGYHFDHPLAPARKERKHIFGCQDTRLQKLFDENFKYITEPTDSDLSTILLGNVNEFVTKVSSFYICPSDNEATVLRLISTAKLLFELQSGSITTTLRRFACLAPFFMNWICKRTSFTKAPGNASFSGHYMCKMHSEKHSCCPFKFTLRLNFSSQTVTFDVRTAHNHDYFSMVTYFPPDYLRSHIEAICASPGGNSAKLLKINTFNSLSADILEALCFMYIPIKYFRNITLRDPIVKNRKSEFCGTGDWNQDIAGIVSRYRNGGMHCKLFSMGGFNAALVATDTIFSKIVKEKQILMMDTTCGVCNYEDAKLISITYRNELGRARVGIAALARPKDGSFDDISAFINAVFAFAKERCGLSEQDAFAKLSYFIIDECMGEEKAVHAAFNRLPAPLHHVTILYCQWHMASSFAKRLGRASEAYKAMCEAIYATSEARFNELVKKALSLLASNKAKANNQAKANNIAKAKYIKGSLKSKEKWAGCYRQSPVFPQVREKRKIDTIHSRWRSPSFNGGLWVSEKLTPLALADQLSIFFGSEYSENSVEIQRANLRRRCSK